MPFTVRCEECRKEYDVPLALMHNFCSEECREIKAEKECCGIPAAPKGIQDFILNTQPKDWTNKPGFNGIGGSYAILFDAKENVWIEFSNEGVLSYAGFYVRMYSPGKRPYFGGHSDGVVFYGETAIKDPCVTYGKTTRVNNKFKEVHEYYKNIQDNKQAAVDAKLTNFLKEKFGC